MINFICSCAISIWWIPWIGSTLLQVMAKFHTRKMYLKILSAKCQLSWQDFICAKDICTNLSGSESFGDVTSSTFSHMLPPPRLYRITYLSIYSHLVYDVCVCLAYCVVHEKLCATEIPRPHDYKELIIWHLPSVTHQWAEIWNVYLECFWERTVKVFELRSTSCTIHKRQWCLPSVSHRIYEQSSVRFSSGQQPDRAFGVLYRVVLGHAIPVRYGMDIHW